MKTDTKLSPAAAAASLSTVQFGDADPEEFSYRTFAAPSVHPYPITRAYCEHWINLPVWSTGRRGGEHSAGDSYDASRLQIETLATYYVVKHYRFRKFLRTLAGDYPWFFTSNADRQRGMGLVHVVGRRLIRLCDCVPAGLKSYSRKRSKLPVSERGSRRGGDCQLPKFCPHCRYRQTLLPALRHLTVGFAGEGRYWIHARKEILLPAKTAAEFVAGVRRESSKFARNAARWTKEEDPAIERAVTHVDFVPCAGDRPLKAYLNFFAACRGDRSRTAGKLKRYGMPTDCYTPGRRRKFRRAFFDNTAHPLLRLWSLRSYWDSAPAGLAGGRRMDSGATFRLLSALRETRDCNWMHRFGPEVPARTRKVRADPA